MSKKQDTTNYIAIASFLLVVLVTIFGAVYNIRATEDTVARHAKEIAETRVETRKNKDDIEILKRNQAVLVNDVGHIKDGVERIEKRLNKEDIK